MTYDPEIMWFRTYKDYPIDKPLIKYQVVPGEGIIGCEMHEINGWGDHIYQKPSPKRSYIKKVIDAFFKKNS